MISPWFVAYSAPMMTCTPAVCRDTGGFLRAPDRIVICNGQHVDMMPLRPFDSLRGRGDAIKRVTGVDVKHAGHSSRHHDFPAHLDRIPTTIPQNKPYIFTMVGSGSVQWKPLATQGLKKSLITAPRAIEFSAA